VSHKTKVMWAYAAISVAIVFAVIENEAQKYESNRSMTEYYLSEYGV
jgi:hypothetical protein